MAASVNNAENSPECDLQGLLYDSKVLGTVRQGVQLSECGYLSGNGFSLETGRRV